MDKYWSDKPKFLNWNREDYIKNNVLYTVPMTAKEVDESKQEELLNSPNYFVEEKLDGTRGTIHFTLTMHEYLAVERVKIRLADRKH